MTDFRMRSNYFKVKDEAAFKAFCRDCQLTILREDGLYGFCAFNEVASHRPSGAPADFGYKDFVLELAKHLEDGYIAIVKEVGHSGLMWLNGKSMAVNNKGKLVAVDINDIYVEGSHLGEHCTDASF